jgi:hypothetical protein
MDGYSRQVGAVPPQIGQQLLAIAFSRFVDVLILLLEEIPSDAALVSGREMVQQDEQAPVMDANLADRPANATVALDTRQVEEQRYRSVRQPPLDLTVAIGRVSM